jgi:hypothetical protein
MKTLNSVSKQSGAKQGLDLDCRASEPEKRDDRGERETWLFWLQKFVTAFPRLPATLPSRYRPQT